MTRTIEKLPAAGFLWLFAHEARLLWRGSILVRTRRHVLVPIIGVAVLFQTIALLVAMVGLRTALSPATLVMVANLNLVFLFCLMLSRAMTSAIDVLYARGDVDFLLASPIPPSRVLAVRMLGVAAATASPWLLLGGALANALAVFGKWRALAVYPMIFGVALVTAALAFGLVVFLVGRTGPRVARTIAQTSALTVGVAIFALGQAPRFIAPAKMAVLWRSFMPDGTDGNSPLWLPGRAMLGESGPLLASLAACVLIFVFAMVTLDKKFASGAISAAAFAPGRRPGARPGQFKDNAFAAIMLKNLRLLTRFPGLVTQTVYRSLTLVPVAVILTGHASLGVGPQVVVPLVVFLSGQLSLFFCSVIIASDQAPDLFRAAPVPAGMNKRASGAASLYATMLIMALPLMGILLREPPNLAVTIAFTLGATVSNLALAQNFPIPLMRAEFGKSQKGSVMGLMIGVAVSSVWALAAYMIVTPEPFAFLRTGTVS